MQGRASACNRPKALFKVNVKIHDGHLGLVWVCTLWVTIVMWPALVKNSGPPRLEWASLSAQLERSMHLWGPHRGRTGKPMLTPLVFACMYHYSAVPALCPWLHKSWLWVWLCWVTSPSSNSLVGGHGTPRQPPFWTAALPSCLWYHSLPFFYFLADFFFFHLLCWLLSLPDSKYNSILWLYSGPLLSLLSC